MSLKTRNSEVGNSPIRGPPQRKSEMQTKVVPKDSPGNNGKGSDATHVQEWDYRQARSRGAMHRSVRKPLEIRAVTSKTSSAVGTAAGNS